MRKKIIILILVCMFTAGAFYASSGKQAHSFKGTPDNSSFSMANLLIIARQSGCDKETIKSLEGMQ